jgi:hypothetical protein
MRQSVQFALGLASILAMLWAPDAPAQGRAPSSALLRQIDALREEKASRGRAWRWRPTAPPWWTSAPT